MVFVGSGFKEIMRIPRNRIRHTDYDFYGFLGGKPIVGSGASEMFQIRADEKIFFVFNDAKLDLFVKIHNTGTEILAFSNYPAFSFVSFSIYVCHLIFDGSYNLMCGVPVVTFSWEPVKDAEDN